ncbi:MAG: hypothetical protein MJ224_04190 [archaeon]|nr:hypothetical protein [archaeon]
MVICKFCKHENYDYNLVCVNCGCYLDLDHPVKAPSTSESESDFDDVICPMCGSSSFVGGYCDDCGWIE